MAAWELWIGTLSIPGTGTCRMATSLLLKYFVLKTRLRIVFNCGTWPKSGICQGSARNHGEITRLHGKGMIVLSGTTCLGTFSCLVETQPKWRHVILILLLLFCLSIWRSLWLQQSGGEDLDTLLMFLGKNQSHGEFLWWRKECPDGC